MPGRLEARLLVSLQIADRECLSKGVTSFQDAGSSLATLDVMREMVEQGELGTRLWIMIRDGKIQDRCPGSPAATTTAPAGRVTRP